MERVSNEKQLRDWMRGLWKDDKCVQLSWCEPGMGSTVGIPDVWLMIGGQWLPIELKHGTIKGGYLKCNVRPAQINWHTSVHKAGGKSLFIVGTMFGIYALPGRYCNEINSERWEGWPKRSFALLQNRSHFVSLLKHPSLFDENFSFAFEKILADSSDTEESNILNKGSKQCQQSEQGQKVKDRKASANRRAVPESRKKTTEKSKTQATQSSSRRKDKESSAPSTKMFAGKKSSKKK